MEFLQESSSQKPTTPKNKKFKRLVKKVISMCNLRAIGSNISQHVLKGNPSKYNSYVIYNITAHGLAKSDTIEISTAKFHSTVEGFAEKYHFAFDSIPLDKMYNETSNVDITATTCGYVAVGEQLKKDKNYNEYASDARNHKNLYDLSKVSESDICDQGDINDETMTKLVHDIKQQLGDINRPMYENQHLNLIIYIVNFTYYIKYAVSVLGKVKSSTLKKHYKTMMGYLVDLYTILKIDITTFIGKSGDLIDEISVNLKLLNPRLLYFLSQKIRDLTAKTNIDNEIKMFSELGKNIKVVDEDDLYGPEPTEIKYDFFMNYLRDTKKHGMLINSDITDFLNYPVEDIFKQELRTKNINDTYLQLKPNSGENSEGVHGLNILSLFVLDVDSNVKSSIHENLTCAFEKEEKEMAKTIFRPNSFATGEECHTTQCALLTERQKKTKEFQSGLGYKDDKRWRMMNYQYHLVYILEIFLNKHIPIEEHQERIREILYRFEGMDLKNKCKIPQRGSVDKHALTAHLNSHLSNLKKYLNDVSSQEEPSEINRIFCRVCELMIILNEFRAKETLMSRIMYLFNILLDIEYTIGVNFSCRSLSSEMTMKHVKPTQRFGGKTKRKTKRKSKKRKTYKK